MVQLGEIRLTREQFAIPPYTARFHRFFLGL
ncbi:Uncharacterised protein [Vibrio cholerae]|nr:Uncharacterised protein [Vibrio cholerae]